MTDYQGHADQLALVVNFSQRYKGKRRHKNEIDSGRGMCDCGLNRYLITTSFIQNAVHHHNLDDGFCPKA